MVAFIEAKKRIRMIIEGRDAGRWPNTNSLLSGAAWLYGLLTKTYYSLYDHGILRSHGLACCVISVGNLTAGGTGKTPMTIYIAKYLQKIGCRVVILSRGYGGQAQKKGGIVSDGHNIYMDPDKAGDEAFMMAASLAGIPVLVGKNRYSSGQIAIRKFQADVIILDDGYQHLRLRRDLNLLLLDAQKPYGNGNLLPRGSLRAPKHHSQRADAVVFTRCETETGISAEMKRIANSKKVFFSRHKPVSFQVLASPSRACSKLVPIEAATLVGNKVMAFSGIANNFEFKKSLLSFGVTMVGFLEFDDHHRYTDDDISACIARFHDQKARWLATTEKDYYRICHRIDPAVPLIVIGVEIEFFENGEAFNAFIHRTCRTPNALSLR